MKSINYGGSGIFRNFRKNCKIFFFIDSDYTGMSND